MRGMQGLEEAAARVMEATEDGSESMETITETRATMEAYLAGFLTGRGGFGNDEGRLWAYFITLDHAIADEAVRLWGGHIVETRTQAGGRKFKYTANNEQSALVLEAIRPHLCGSKRETVNSILDTREAAA